MTRANANAMLAFTFFGELVDLFKSYFGKFDENALKQNFVIIHELLDEILDHGFPQITSAAVLQSYITQKSVRSILDDQRTTGGFDAAERAKAVSMQVTGAVLVACAGADVQEERGVSRHHRECVASMSPKGNALRAAPRGLSR